MKVLSCNLCGVGWYLFVLVALSFLGLSSAYARLGETESELAKRFGRVVVRQPQQVLSSEAGRLVTVGERLLFRHEMWQVTAVLVRGSCLEIMYAKPGEWTEEQFTALLTSNAAKLTWREIKSPLPKAKREWKRDDGATAVWIMPRGFTLTDPAFEKHKTAAVEAAKRKAADVPQF